MRQGRPFQEGVEDVEGKEDHPFQKRSIFRTFKRFFKKNNSSSQEFKELDNIIKNRIIPSLKSSDSEKNMMITIELLKSCPSKYYWEKQTQMSWDDSPYKIIGDPCNSFSRLAKERFF